MAGDAMLLPIHWQAPPGVRVAVTVRTGGQSQAPYDSFNLGDHVGDDPAAVAHNRARLAQMLGLSLPPQWLRQVHGTDVVTACADDLSREGDAVWSDIPGLACAVLTADCLPVVLASADGRAVAVAHCGWRGLAAGVLSHTVSRIGAGAAPIRAWLGPAIGPSAFEVGEDVRDAFFAALPATHGAGVGAAFVPVAGRPGKFLADLYALARMFLSTLGVEDVCGGGHCTFSESERFFSYRRDGVTGRMATLAWIDPAQGKPPIT